MERTQFLTYVRMVLQRIATNTVEGYQGQEVGGNGIENIQKKLHGEERVELDL